MADELVFGHSRKTAESTYVKTMESDRTGANEKRGEAMENEGIKETYRISRYKS